MLKIAAAIDSALNKVDARGTLLRKPSFSICTRELVTTFGQIQLQNGSSIYMEYQYSDNLPLVQDQRRFFKVVFSLAGFPFVPLSGGISILNPAQIVGCLFHPGGEPPSDAWAVQTVEALDTV